MKNNLKSIMNCFSAVIAVLFMSILFCISVSAATSTVTVPKVSEFEVSSVESTSVTLSWKADGSVTGYKLYRYDAKTKKYTGLYAGKKTKLTLTGLEAGREYEFRVRAYIKKASKVYNGKMTSLKCCTGLDRVSGLTQTYMSSDTQKIKWTKVDGADGYRVYYLDAQSGKYKLLGTTKNTYCKLSKLSSACVYTYKVKAYATKSDGARIYGKSSAAFKAITRPAPVSSLTASNITTNSFVLNWNKTDGAQGYRIYIRDAQTGKTSALANVRGALSYTVTGKESASTYVYLIKSFATVNSKTVFSSSYGPVKITTKPETTTVQILKDLPSNGKIKISWTAVDGADGYLIYTSYTKNSGFVLKKNVGANVFEYTISGLNNSKPVYIKVKPYVSVDGKKTYGSNSKLVGGYA